MQATTVVGYQNSGIVPADGYYCTTCTFEPVGGGVVKLGDISVTSNGTSAVTYANFTAYMCAEDGESAFVSEETLACFDQELRDQILAKYEDEELSFCYVAEEGNWYLSVDGAASKRKFCMNNFLLPAGTALKCEASNKVKGGAKLIYSGQVCVKEQSVVCPADGYVLTGNTAPMDMKLGEFSVTSNGTSAVTYANFTLYMVAEDGESAFVSEETLACFDQELRDQILAKYEDEELSFCYVAEEGKWYLSVDGAASKRRFCMNDYIIKAGEGFKCEASNKVKGGAKVILPAVKLD